jgi:hypothetical protein
MSERMRDDLVPGEWEVDSCYVFDRTPRLHRCQACNQKNVRYRHRIRHIETGKTMDVGISCCGVLIMDPDLAQRLENEVKRKLSWREHYQTRTWKPCRATPEDLAERKRR